MHSKMFKKIQKWYQEGNWTARMVGDAVVKGKITAAEYEEIVGEPYADDEEDGDGENG